MNKKMHRIHQLLLFHLLFEKSHPSNADFKQFKKGALLLKQKLEEEQNQRTGLAKELEECKMRLEQLSSSGVVRCLGSAKIGQSPKIN